MELSCRTQELAVALARMKRMVIPNVLLTAEGHSLRITAVNPREVAVTCWIDASITRQGAIGVPLRPLLDFVKGAPKEALHMSLDPVTNELALRCERSKASITTLDSNTFPAAPLSQDTTPILAYVPPETLRDMTEKTTFAAETTETRPILGHVLLELAASDLTMVASDGHRMSICKGTCTAWPNNKGPEGFSILIPAQAVRMLGHLCAKESKLVEVRTCDGHAFFSMDGLELCAPLWTESAYVQWRTLLQRYKHKIFLSVATKEAQKAARQAKQLAGKRGLVCLIVNAEDSTLTFTTKTDQGTHADTLDAKVSGTFVTVAVNASYLAEALSVVDTPQVTVQIQEQELDKPIVPIAIVADTNDVAFVHLVMPCMVG